MGVVAFFSPRNFLISQQVKLRVLEERSGCKDAGATSVDQSDDRTSKNSPAHPQKKKKEEDERRNMVSHLLLRVHTVST